MFQKKSVETIKTHILFTIMFFFLNLAFYEIMGRNTAERDRPQMAIWRMCIACCTPKATHSGCAVLIAFPLQQWLLHESAPMSRLHVHCLSVVNQTVGVKVRRSINNDMLTQQTEKHGVI
jgi:hypothetical protein